MNRGFQNILVIRTDRIGDVILTTPALKALRTTYPMARITLLVAPLTLPLVEDNPYVDDIIVDDREQEHKGFWGTVKLIQFLRSKKFDIVINYHTKKRTNFLSFAAGIPVRLAYDNGKFSFLLTHRVEDRRHFGEKHESDYCLDLLETIGVKSHGKELYVSLRETAEEWVGQFRTQNHITEDKPFIVIHPGASDPSKTWAAKNYGILIDKLIEDYGAQVFLIGSMAIRPLARKIKGYSMHAPGDLTGMTSIPQLISLVKNADLLISNDSGPVHVACAVHTPVISIFTRNRPGINPERWRPLGELTRSLYPPPGTEFVNTEEDAKVPEINEFISVSHVLQAVDAFIKL